MSLLPVLTAAGAAALEAALGAGTSVHVTSVRLGSAARAPTGLEIAVTTPIGNSHAISSSSYDPVANQENLAVSLAGTDLGLVADATVREIGFFSDAGALIFYWSSANSALGLIGPLSAFSIVLSVAMGAYPAGAITVADAGDATELLLQQEVTTLQGQVTAVQAKLAAGGQVAAGVNDLAAVSGKLAAGGQVAAGVNDLAAVSWKLAAGGQVAAGVNDLAAVSGKLAAGGQVAAGVADLAAVVAQLPTGAQPAISRRRAAALAYAL